MAVLINGMGYGPVTAQQDADLYGGLLGLPLTVLPIGQQMAATIIDANTVRIGDGEAVVQGRRIHNDPGEYDDFTIQTGSQGVTKNYIIGYEYYLEPVGGDITTAEKIRTFVQEGSSAPTEAVIRDGATSAYFSFYRVTQEGISISNVTPLYTSAQNQVALLETISTLRSTITALQTQVNNLQSVSVLDRGTVIPSNADLNAAAYRTPGKYYSPSGTVTNTLSHKPSVVNVGFTMEVMRVGSIYRQTIYAGRASAVETYARHYDGSTWSSWDTFVMYNNS